MHIICFEGLLNFVEGAFKQKETVEIYFNNFLIQLFVLKIFLCFIVL